MHLGEMIMKIRRGDKGKRERLEERNQVRWKISGVREQFLEKARTQHVPVQSLPRVIDPPQTRQTVDLLTNVQTFLNHREHRMNI